MFELVMYKRLANGEKSNQKVSMQSVDGKDLATFFIRNIGKKRVRKSRKN